MAYSRREFITVSAAALGSLPLAGWNTPTPPADDLSIHLFSKHLQFLDYPAMAKAAKAIGFDGVDLTVRPNGHVEPEQVETDLPKAIAALQDAGLEHVMMTTAVDDAQDEIDQRVLRTAADLGIQYYRMNWLKYSENETLPETLDSYQKQMKKLSKLNKKLGLVGCYQNHSGLSVGAAIWEIWTILQKADPADLGCQYDIRHGMVEGGRSWENGVRLITPYIRTIVIKDFKWEEKEGKWNLVNTPLGEGMVDFDAYFKILKANKIQVPVSLHLEYPLGGAEKGRREIEVEPEVVFDAMKRDLAKLKQLWAAA